MRRRKRKLAVVLLWVACMLAGTAVALIVKEKLRLWRSDSSTLGSSSSVLLEEDDREREEPLNDDDLHLEGYDVTSE